MIPVIEADPLVVLSVGWTAETKIHERSSTSLSRYTKQCILVALLTVHKLLLLLGRDADQVRVQLLTALLSTAPGLALGEVQVAVPPELLPALLTSLRCYAHQQGHTLKN